LLAILAELGIFVVEHQGPRGVLQTAFGTRTDFAIVVGENHPEHHTVVRELIDALSSVVVALVPTEAGDDAYRTAGATAVIPEGVSEEEFVRLIAPAVRQARWLRGLGELAAEFIVFRDVRFRTLPPELARAGQTVPLARGESEVLAELARARGKPVSTAELERRLSHTSSRSAIHAGYVKTIVLRIRRKVEELGGNPLLLRNVRGFGYMLVD
jgi:DNA-binding response OmpR family regulator